MNNYIVSWNDGGSDTKNFLVTATSFTESADIVWSKSGFSGFITSISLTNLSIDKIMGFEVYYIVMSDETKFLVTSNSWMEVKDWVYTNLGSSVNTIMNLGLTYIQ